MRTHDEEVYLVENRYEAPKSIHLFLISELLRVWKSDESILDVGCAAGELLFNINKMVPGVQRMYGEDVIDSLLEKASAAVPNACFKNFDCSSREFDQGVKVGYVICSDVLGIFDDHLLILDNLLSRVKCGGYLFVTWIFNDFDVDVWVRYKDYFRHADERREAGWNIFGKPGISRWLEERKDVASHSFKPFYMDKDLPMRPTDPARCWTFKSENGDRITRNGLNLIADDSLLIIKKIGRF